MNRWVSLRAETKTARHQRAVDALKQVDLDVSLMKAKPRDLGASTLQRINIARALICKPDFVVLDEPTSVLAPRARNSLIALLARLQVELGISLPVHQPRPDDGAISLPTGGCDVSGADRRGRHR